MNGTREILVPWVERGIDELEAFELQSVQLEPIQPEELQREELQREELEPEELQLESIQLESIEIHRIHQEADRRAPVQLERSEREAVQVQPERS